MATPNPAPIPSPAPDLKQPAMIVIQPQEASQAVLKAAVDWEQQEKSSLFLMTCNRGDAVAFSRTFVDRLCAARNQFENIEKLDLLLDHYGGSLDAAFQLIVFLRNRCQYLRVIVPDFAKSASTLMTLGADEILMTDYAEIGPLDAQIPDPHDPDQYISALDEFRSVDYLRTHSFEILNEVDKTLKRTTSLPTKDRLRFSIDFTTSLMAPMYSSVDPLHFGGSHRSVELGTEYGRRVMSRYAYRNWPIRDINNLLRKLTWDYPSHGFVIDILEAQELGLNVNLLDGKLSILAHTIVDGVTAGCGFIGRQPQTAT